MLFQIITWGIVFYCLFIIINKIQMTAEISNTQKKIKKYIDENPEKFITDKDE